MHVSLFENHVQYRLTRGVSLPPLPLNLGGAARDPGRGRRATEIADLVRFLLRLPTDAPVTVFPLVCREPGCPPVETVIAVLAPPRRRWTIHRPLAQIDDGVVTDLLTHNPQGESHD
jgi:hypothetical protein